jgi:cold shock protein
MEQGTVKWFNDAKGYGFISRSPATMFSCICQPSRQAAFRSLHEGETIEFHVTKGLKGLQAENVRPV